ncbi:MAG: hypothetical protein QM757_45755 [Paludibaculum sp.]
MQITKSARHAVLVLLSACLLPATPLSFTVFTTPPPGVNSNGTIGFTYAGDMFVGSVYHSGLNSLYSTDLNGGNQQVFAPTVSIPGSPQRNILSPVRSAWAAFRRVTFTLGLPGASSTSRTMDRPQTHL